MEEWSDPMDLLAAIEQDLNRRINPERSRNFSQNELKKSRHLLAELAGQEWLSSSATRISLVGTNGKGSTALYLSHLLTPSSPLGPPVGLYTSPHLLTVNERIRINNRPVEVERLWNSMSDLKEHLGTLYESFTYFEILTILALRHFRTEGCRWEIYEAGLGGRLDATRMAAASVTVLTSLSLDHTEILGDSLRKILTEKLGILHEGSRHLFAFPSPGVPLSWIREYLESYPRVEFHLFPETLAEKDDSYLEFNHAYARFVLETLGVAVGNSPSPPPLPGRLERGSLRRDDANATLYFDTAHNEEAFRNVLSALEHREGIREPGKVLVVLGLLKERSVAAALALLRREGFTHILVLQGEEFAPAPPGTAQISRESAVKEISLYCRREGLTHCLITGSHRIYSIFRELADQEDGHG